MSFERFNKKIKGMVGNSTHPVSSLKSALLRDAGIYYLVVLISLILHTTNINSHIRTYSDVIQEVERSRGFC